MQVYERAHEARAVLVFTVCRSHFTWSWRFNTLSFADRPGGGGRFAFRSRYQPSVFGTLTRWKYGRVYPPYGPGRGWRMVTVA